MVLECPVICADFDGAKEQFRNSVLFFDKLDEYSLIQQVNSLKDKNVRSKLIDNGKKLAQKRSISSYINNMKSILLEFEKN